MIKVYSMVRGPKTLCNLGSAGQGPQLQLDGDQELSEDVLHGLHMQGDVLLRHSGVPVLPGN